jgi:hypothetical protein
MPYRTEAPETYVRLLPVISRMECFGCDWKCIYDVGPDSPVPCISNVSVDAVWAQVQRALDSKENGRRRDAYD